MYKNLVLVSSRADRQTAFAIAPDLRHLSHMTAVPIGLSEAEAIAKDYPILFTATDRVAPVALLGLQGVNEYLTSNGSWAASVMPGWIRLYPFVFVETPPDAGSAGEPVWRLARDAAAPHFSLPDGQPMFDAKGQPGPLLQKVLEQANLQHGDCLKAQALAGQLAEAGLIVDRAIELGTGEDMRSYTGFKAAAGDGTPSLDEVTRTRLERSGAMRLLALHRKSLTNLINLFKPGSASATIPQ